MHSHGAKFQSYKTIQWKNLPLAIKIFSPMYQYYEFIVHPSRGILYTD